MDDAGHVITHIQRPTMPFLAPELPANVAVRHNNVADGLQQQQTRRHAHDTMPMPYCRLRKTNSRKRRR